jgi:hypothetical protein
LAHHFYYWNNNNNNNIFYFFFKKNLKTETLEAPQNRNFYWRMECPLSNCGTSRGASKRGETFRQSKGDKSVVLFGNLGNSLGTPPPSSEKKTSGGWWWLSLWPLVLVPHRSWVQICCRVNPKPLTLKLHSMSSATGPGLKITAQIFLCWEIAPPDLKSVVLTWK